MRKLCLTYQHMLKIVWYLIKADSMGSLAVTECLQIFAEARNASYRDSAYLGRKNLKYWKMAVLYFSRNF